MIKTIKIKAKYIGNSNYFKYNEYYTILVFYDKSSELTIYANDKRTTYININVFLQNWSEVSKHEV